MDSLIVRWCDIEYGSIDTSKRRMFRNNLELSWNIGDFASLHKKVYRHDLMFETLKTFASLRREVYWDDLELYWNVGTCKSVCSVLEFGLTRNYLWQNYVGLQVTTGVL